MTQIITTMIAKLYKYNIEVGSRPHAADIEIRIIISSSSRGLIYYIYIYIYREREKERDVYIYIYIYVYYYYYYYDYYYYYRSRPHAAERLPRRLPVEPAAGRRGADIKHVYSI